MKFMMTYQISTADWEDAVTRFLAGTERVPEGLTLVNRWHAAAGRYGYLLLEGDDPALIYEYSGQWHDLCDIDVTPVIEDEAAAAVLQGLRD